MKINSMTFTHLLLASVLALASLAAQASGKFTYYAVDANGSRVVAMDESGVVIWRKTYAPYGKASGNDRDNRIGYTGHVENANGLVDAGARHYDPALGMFTSDDPVRFDENNPASFNRYAYANNNPYKYVDPSGKTPETIWDVGNVLVGAASFSANMAAGNYGGAAVDAVGVVIDAAAAITPLVPGGAGAAIKAVRGADNLVDATGVTGKAIYHRLGDSAENIEKIKSTGELRGNPANNFYASDIPKVKAYKGELPEGKQGFEFTTEAMVDRGGRPNQPTWSGNGHNPDVRTENGQAVISCTVTKVGC